MDGNAKKDEAITPSAPPAEATGASQPTEPAAVPRRVIRTFASDMAALNGAPVAEAKIIPQSQIHNPSAKPTLAESVSQIPAEPAAPAPIAPPPPPQPAWTPPPAPAPEPIRTPEPIQNEPARIPVPEKVAVVTEQTPGFFSRLFAGLFKKKDLGVHVTTLSSTSPSAWASAPSRPAPVSTEVYATPTPSDEAREREEVLARLRAKVATREAETAAMPPVFTAPAPELAPAPPKPAWTPPPAPTAPAPAPVGDERLRTYSGDFSTRVDTQQASAFSVLAAQADSAPTSAPVVEVQKSGGHGLAFAIAGTILIVGGSLALYYAYEFMGTNAPVDIITENPGTLVTGDDSFALSGSGTALIDALAAKASEPLTIGTVRVAYLEVATTTATGVETVSEPGGALLKAMSLPAPDILLRNIDDESTVGIIHAGDQTRPFFVLGTRSYERTFAGMLAWEATMGKDLAVFYPAYPVFVPPVVEIATSTASTTTPVAVAAASSTPPKPVFKAGFSDAVVESHDVRVLKDEEGRTLLIYGYRDQHTLIIARDETTFSLLLARLSASGAH